MNLPANAGNVRDMGLIPGEGRSPGEGHDNPLQYSCLEDPMDKGAWQAMVHRVAKSQTRLKWLSMHVCTHTRVCVSVCVCVWIHAEGGIKTFSKYNPSRKEEHVWFNWKAESFLIFHNTNSYFFLNLKFSYQIVLWHDTWFRGRYSLLIEGIYHRNTNAAKWNHISNLFRQVSENRVTHFNPHQTYTKILMQRLSYTNTESAWREIKENATGWLLNPQAWSCSVRVWALTK